MTENNPNETPEDNSTTTINQTDIVNEMANVFHEDQVRDDGVETALHCSFPGCNLKFGWWGMRRPFLTTIEDDEAAVKGRCKRATAKALKDLREHHGMCVNSVMLFWYWLNGQAFGSKTCYM